MEEEDHAEFSSRKMSQLDTEHHVSVGLEHVMSGSTVRVRLKLSTKTRSPSRTRK